MTLLKKIERTAAQVRSICCLMVSAKIATREVSENGGEVLLGDGGLYCVGEWCRVFPLQPALFYLHLCDLYRPTQPWGTHRWGWLALVATADSLRHSSPNWNGRECDGNCCIAAANDED